MRNAIKGIMDGITDELVITSAGTISREVFAYKDRPENLYLMGALGCTLGVGIGLALNTKRKVVVIAGDGDVLMSMGTLVLLGYLTRYKGLKGIELYIVNNYSYAATGCQQSCSPAIYFDEIVKCHVLYVRPEKSDAPRITLTPVEIQRRFYDSINSVQ